MELGDSVLFVSRVTGGNNSDGFDRVRKLFTVAQAAEAAENWRCL
jgi:hypothetical protein